MRCIAFLLLLFLLLLFVVDLAVSCLSAVKLFTAALVLLVCPFSDSSGSGHQRQSPKSVPRYRGAGVQGYMDTRAQAHAGLWQVVPCFLPTNKSTARH